MFRRILLVACARRERDREAEALHVAIRDAIIEAMRATGDGSSAQRPLTPISVDEEYALLEIVGLRRATRRVVQRDGRSPFWRVRPVSKKIRRCNEPQLSYAREWTRFSLPTSLICVQRLLAR